MVLMRYSGARGTLIYEKNLKSKISCQTPFKIRLSIRVGNFAAPNRNPKCFFKFFFYFNPKVALL